MLSQRLRWLLPALIVSWTSLQLGAASPARNDRSHVSADAFDPSAATSTIIREDHDGRAHHPPSGKNETQSSHKLVASPAGLLRPDKFQFYTYDEKGDMITRQMTAQEIQGLIAAGGADHVAINRQEPQKADDVLTGGKKVMDVVQKVQNVLKSALDKPPTLTGSIPKIPEHANVEWSNILPSILSGEADAISPNSESNQLSHKPTTEKTESASKYPTRKPTTSDVQTNAYAGFSNNVQGKPHHGTHHSQQATEKPMIPVPVITLTEHKLSTLQSAVTESPIFQIISVIPVESVGAGDQGGATRVPAQTEKSQTEKYVEVTLSEVPGDTTFPQLTSLDMYPVSITKQTSATYSTTTPGMSTHSSFATKPVGSSVSTSPANEIPPSDANLYILVKGKNGTKVSDSSFASGVTKGTQVHNSDKISSQQINTLTTPISHASPKPEETSHSTLASVTRVKTPIKPTSSHTVVSDHYLGEGYSTIMKEPSVTPTYGENYLNPLPTEIHSPAPIGPLPTQLIDSFSSVINQVSAMKPTVLPLSSFGTPQGPILNINYDQRRNVSEGSIENARPIYGQTITTQIPSRDTTTSNLVDYSVNYRPLNTAGEDANSRITASNNRVTTNDLATTPAGLKSTQNDAAVLGSTASSPVRLQLEKTHVTATAASPAGQTEKTSSTWSDTTGTQSTTASIDANLFSNKPTEDFGNTLASLNLSDPVSAIDKILSIAPLPSSTPAIEPIDLPANVSDYVFELANNIASSLIVGFTTTPGSSKFNAEKIGNDQTAENTSNEYTKLTQESIENAIKIYENTRVKPNDQKEGNITQSTQDILTDPVRNGTLTQTKKSNDTLESTKLPSSNERIDDFTKAPSSSPANKLTSINDESKDTVGLTGTTVKIVTINPERTTTAMTDASIRSPGVNKTSNEKVDEEKVRTTEAPIVRTEPSSDLLESFIKIVNDTGNSKIEAGERNGTIVIASSSTEETVAIHPIYDSISEPSSQSEAYIRNFTTDTSVSYITSNENSTVPTFSPNRVSTADYKDKDNTQNKKDAEPIKVTPDNSVSNTSNQNGENVAQTTSTHDGHTNNTENKIASLKHSEPKPDATRLQTSTLPSSVPIRETSRPAAGHKPLEKSDVTKTGADVNTEDKWTLISQQVPSMSKLPKPPKPPKPLRRPGGSHGQTNESSHVRSPGAEAAAQEQQLFTTQTSFLPLDASQSAIGLDNTIRHTSGDIVNFAKLCNELAFNFWVATNKGLSTARSLALSPFGMTSLLAMIFLGARGPTSDQMNEVLGLDDVATFNPHLIFQNITDAVGLARGQGIANAAFVRELFADKMKVRKLMPFYKEQAQQFYEGLVAEVNFATISDLVRRRTNLLVRKQTGGRIKDFVKTNTVPLRSPLAALSANVFQTDCNSSLASSIGRDGELYFAVSPAVRQRKLVPVPATTWRSGVLAGYEPSIDATAIALGGSDKLVSTIFVLPGQQGHTAPGDTLDRLEQRLVRSAFRDGAGAWNKLLKVLIPRHGLELQLPKFSHRSVVNATAALKRMGLDELFSGNADFKGINGVGHRLHLADVLQMNLFSTCGDENILSGRHHVETYPASPLRRSVERRMEDDSSSNVAEEDTPRHGVLEDNVDQSRADLYGFYREERQLSGSSERPRLKLDRPFLYFVRHNPSGIILHMGRFNPRLLP